VILFLIVTTGLLVYAMIRPYIQSWLAVCLFVRGADGDRSQLISGQTFRVQGHSMRVCQRRFEGRIMVLGLIPDWQY
jgi:hypothetical protein